MKRFKGRRDSDDAEELNDAANTGSEEFGEEQLEDEGLEDEELEELNDQLNEQVIQCPFCGEPIPVFVDCSIPDQEYIEDCSVCCRPIQIEVQCEDGTVVSLQTERS